MKLKKRWWVVALCMFLCLTGMYSTVLADNGDGAASGISVSVSDWNRRIYKLICEVNEEDSEGASIRIYAGKHFHVTDSQGNILSEGTTIGADGNPSSGSKTGQVCRDANGWYILWESPELSQWTNAVYVQADSDFVGGNNQTIGIRGMSGVYLSKDSGTADTALDTLSVNVAAEVDASDIVFPVMRGINMSSSEFVNKASVRLSCVYGNLSDLPLKVQWYRVTDGVEEVVGDAMTKAPYHLPESEALALTEAREYRVKIYYNGEASTAESRKNSSGYEVSVSEDTPMDEATFRTEILSGHIRVTVNLEQLPYNNSYASNTFRFRLYRFDKANQVIDDDTPYTSYELTFEVNGTEATKTLDITDLTAGWYTLVPENPEGDFAEISDTRTDNALPNARKGSSAGIDFYIGQIVDNKYSWEVIRYQGQDSENLPGDNFFKITYNYRETVYGVSYAMNLPGGSGLIGTPPIDLNKYRQGDIVPVQGGNGMSANGWQFVGWALDAGNGIYTEGETLYSDTSVHGIPVKSGTEMAYGGLTLYGRWVPIYSVSYDGNTNTAGDVPVETGGTAQSGTAMFYSGDTVTVKNAGNLEKTDSDGTRYVFDGWSVNQDGSGTRLKAGDKLYIDDSDVILYAQWRAVNTDKYAVNYIASIPKDTRLTGVLPLDEDKYEEGAPVTVKGSGDMSVEHYQFAGWSLTSREDGLYQQGEEIFSEGDTVMMKEQGLSFYSRWIPLYHITYRSNGTKVEGLPSDDNEYEVNAKATILSGEGMTREGYEFMGWNTEADGSGQSYDAGLVFNMPGENLQLYAQWKKLPEPESAMDETMSPTEPENGSVWPLVILAIIGVICILSYVVYQWMSHKKR